MKLVKEYINEKFVEDSDPIHDMGIGLFVKHNFNSYNDATNFILKMLPGICKTKQIPKDIVFKPEYHVGAFKWVYFRILENYCKKYITVNEEPLNFNWKICTPLWKRLLEMGYPKIDQMSNPSSKYVNEKFLEDSDPIHDMGIGRKRLIENWLKKYSIQRYTINNDLTIDVNGPVSLKDGKLGNMKKLPSYIQFRNITNGYFSISNNKLESLKGCPRSINNGRTSYNGDFLCHHNKLKSLKYAPSIVSGYFCCQDNDVEFTVAQVEKICKVGLNIEV